jgi:4'-phosphopantetheinyl transferase
MLTIADDEVHLWVVFEHEITDAAVLAAYGALLTSEEQRQAGRFHFERDRHRYLVTRALVKTVLSRYRTVAPAAWRFRKNAYGRPEIEPELRGDSSLSFNLSHTNGIVVCAVATTPSIGVDTECIERAPSPVPLAERFFSAREVRDLKSCPDLEQQELFFHYWTLKESYIKARGKGLSIPLDQFSFDLSRRKSIAIDFHAPLHDTPERLQFWLLQPAPTHLLATCVERPAGTSTRLSVRRCVPMADEEFVHYPLLRCSMQQRSLQES